MAKISGLTVGEVAKRAGLLPTTLRYYESIGLLPNPARENGSRRYDTSIFQRLEMIQTAQQAGFTLAEIRVLFDEILWNDAPAAKWNSLIQRKLQEINIMLMNIQSMKNLLEDILNCDNEHLAECMFQTGQKHRQSIESGD
ncbi:MAG: MerR family transcriptional regulator [Anaerolineaceae bacterium]|nr:MerR family transcriptional regulator [Anaerolineaceae bacterium]